MRAAHSLRRLYLQGQKTYGTEKGASNSIAQSAGEYLEIDCLYCCGELWNQWHIGKRFASRKAGLQKAELGKPSKAALVFPKGMNPPSGPKVAATPSAASKIFSRPILLIAGTFCAGLGTAAGVSALFGVNLPVGSLPLIGGKEEEEADEHHYVNWSNTHEAFPRYVFQPQTEDELQLIIYKAHRKGAKLRCVGSALSPNGIAFSNEAMLSLALLDKVLHVDTASKQVTVQAGARVQEVVEALRPHGLTLQNYASIREQSIGGFTQVSAHGTGAGIPPVDEQVVRLKLITPAMAALELSEASNPKLFRLAKVGLGLLGVVSELTLQCVDAHELLEETTVRTVEEVRRNHKQWLAENRHMKYLWMPYTDSVVVVKNNPVPQGTEKPMGNRDQLSESKKTAPLRNLLEEKLGERAAEEVKSLGGPQLRDQLLGLDPLNTEWVKRVNRAEIEWWRRNEGYRFGPSDQQLGFDCGGQQWVLESCFPTGTLENPSGADLEFMAELMGALERDGVPAPGPIEQRWSSSSSADLSPAACPEDLSHVHSWVGIIMYLPEDDAEMRAKITQSFNAYASLVENKMLEEYHGAPHWAKLEVDRMGLENARKMVASKFPVEKFNRVREELDPKNILSNPMMDAVFPRVEKRFPWSSPSPSS